MPLLDSSWLFVAAQERSEKTVAQLSRLLNLMYDYTHEQVYVEKLFGKS